jgi:hypothetical protein
LYVTILKQQTYFKIEKLDISASKTISSFASKVFFTNYYKTPINITKRTQKFFISSTGGYLNEFIRKAYKGGRTELFAKKARNVSTYDINAAFLAAMYNEYLPVGIPIGPIKVNDPLLRLKGRRFITC